MVSPSSGPSMPSLPPLDGRYHGRCCEDASVVPECLFLCGNATLTASSTIPSTCTSPTTLSSIDTCYKKGSTLLPGNVRLLRVTKRTTHSISIDWDLPYLSDIQLSQGLRFKVTYWATREMPPLLAARSLQVCCPAQSCFPLSPLSSPPFSFHSHSLFFRHTVLLDTLFLNTNLYLLVPPFRSHTQPRKSSFSR